MKKYIVPLSLLLALFFVWVARAGSLQPWAYLPLVNRPLNTATPTPTATATRTPTPVPATSTPIPTQTASPTETASPTATQPLIANINIIGVVPNGAEYVEIRNDGNGSAQLINWTLSDDANHIFIFPAYVIQPGQTCRIYTDENHPEWCGFNYASGSPIWNNDGDCATLRNNDNVLIDQFCY